MEGMLRKTLLSLVMVVSACAAIAQNMTPKNIQSDAFMRRVASTNPRNLIDVGQQIPVFPVAPGTKVSEVYVDNAWKVSSITIYGSEKPVEGYKVRYDLLANAVEFWMSGEIKVLDAKKVKTMIWLDSLTNIPHYFVNGKDFTLDHVPSTSLLELVSDGKLNLYKQYTYWIKRADYNPALNVGSVDEKIYLKANYYYGAASDLALVPMKKKEFPLIFGDKADAIKAFMKEHSLSATKEDELARVFNHYNALP